MKRLSRAQKQAIDKGFDALGAVIRATIRDPDAFPDFLVILPFDPERLSRVFTPERMRLWAELRRSRPKSLTDLAARTGRRVSRVREDIQILQEAKLAGTERKGNRVRPYAEAPNILIASPA